MAKTKYGKYFLTYEGEQNFPLGKILARFDNTTVKGSLFYFLHFSILDIARKRASYK